MKYRILLLMMTIVLGIGLATATASAETLLGSDEIDMVDTVSSDVLGLEAAYYSSACATISKSGSKMTCSGSVGGKVSKTTKISITLYLQKYSGGSWKNTKSWSGSRNGTSYALSKSATVSKGKYRTKAVCKIYSGSKRESITKYSGSKTY